MVLVGKKNPFIYNNLLKINEDVKWFDSEELMIKSFYDILLKYDPDIITGYNIKGFDIPYILERSDILNINNVSFSRDNNIKKIKKYGLQTKIEFAGRLIVDALQLIRKEYNLKQYTLKNVSKELIKKEKIDINPNEMESYWNNYGKKLIKFINYSRRDSEIVLSLLLDLKLMDKYIGLSQITNSITQDIIDGGQTLMVEQMMLKEYLKNDRVFSTKPSENILLKRDIENENLKGGAVLDPIKGLHENVIILDYKSLYPTIMMAYNLCYTTLIENEKLMSILKINDEDIVKTPSGNIFVSKNKLKGIIPTILENLLEKRDIIKSKINKIDVDLSKEEFDSLNATQIAIKILLNSYYGYAGYTRARLYSIDVANSVTSIGRINIENTKNIINNELNKKLIGDIKEDIKFEVIYGDTDSIFVKCNFNNTKSIKNEMENYYTLKNLGNKISNIVTCKLPSPMVLEFESIAKRVLLIAKKRYALWTFEIKNNESYNYIKVKGMETVRRDWCELTSNSIQYILELILKDGKIEDSINYIYTKIKELKLININRNKSLIENLILTRNYSKDRELYKNKQPHITVVDKIYKRTNERIPIGTRIPYLIIAGKDLLVNRAEDPSYVIDKNIPIDVEYYINKQLLQPTKRIFDCLKIKNDLFSNNNYNQTKLFESKSKNNLIEYNKTSKQKVKKTNKKLIINQSTIFDYYISSYS